MKKLFKFSIILSFLLALGAPSQLLAGKYLNHEYNDDKAPIKMAPVNFYFPKNVYHFKVKDEIKAYYAELSEFLKEHKDMKIYLTGFAYDGSKKDWNNRLSKYRANKVRDSLVDAGINKNQIVIDYKGKSAPMAEDDSDKEVAKNRRVELRVK